MASDSPSAWRKIVLDITQNFAISLSAYSVSITKGLPSPASFAPRPELSTRSSSSAAVASP
jgi:hypothetical protein